jgi:hypothetical protein
VQADIKEDMIQRRVANEMKVDLDGYWVATVIEGRCRRDALMGGDKVELTPATADDLRRVTQPRTTAEKEPKKKDADTRTLKPGTMKTNWLAI